MTSKFRGIATSAARMAAVPRTWMGRSGIQLQYLDETHYQPDDAQHLERCTDYCKDEWLACGVTKLEARWVSLTVVHHAVG